MRNTYQNFWSLFRRVQIWNLLDANNLTLASAWSGLIYFCTWIFISKLNTVYYNWPSTCSPPWDSEDCSVALTVVILSSTKTRPIHAHKYWKHTTCWFAYQSFCVQVSATIHNSTLTVPLPLLINGNNDTLCLCIKTAGFPLFSTGKQNTRSHIYLF